jgi:hypothetical protein
MLFSFYLSKVEWQFRSHVHFEKIKKRNDKMVVSIITRNTINALGLCTGTMCQRFIVP